MGFKKSDAFPSEHLSAADLSDQDVTVVIQSLEWVEVGATKDRRVKLNFKGASKGLVLNVTNWNTIENLYGDDTDDWIGHPITLFATQTDFQGKMVDAIRIRTKKPAAKKQKAEPAAQPVDGDLDDSIPF